LETLLMSRINQNYPDLFQLRSLELNKFYKNLEYQMPDSYFFKSKK